MTADSSTEADPREVGIDLAGVRRWLGDHVDGLKGELTATVIAGGRSNLTFLLSDIDGRRWVLRRPPLGHILPTAHDVAREHLILSALQDSAVPVPRLVGLCEDQKVTRAPFYVMWHVDGHVLRRTADVVEMLDETGRAAAGLEMAATLAGIHSVDPDRVGLSALGRREGYLERQLTRWMRQYHDTETEAIPDIERAYQKLVELRPPQRRTAIVHGDYRIDNVIVGDDGAVRAVLDWELCTLGDPLADLGQMMLRTQFAGKVEDGVPQPPLTDAAGFAPADAIVATYEETSRADVSDAGYYIAFAAWKAACIQQGVYVRQRAGVMLGSGGDEAVLRIAVRRRAAEALEILANSR